IGRTCAPRSAPAAPQGAAAFVSGSPVAEAAASSRSCLAAPASASIRRRPRAGTCCAPAPPAGARQHRGLRPTAFAWGRAGQSIPPAPQARKTTKTGTPYDSLRRVSPSPAGSDRHAGDVGIGLLLQMEGAAALRVLVGAFDGP